MGERNITMYVGYLLMQCICVVQRRWWFIVRKGEVVRVDELS